MPPGKPVLPRLGSGYRRVVLIVLDGLGIGSRGPGDPGADTLGSVARLSRSRRGRELRLPHLEALGLYQAWAQGGSGGPPPGPPASIGDPALARLAAGGGGWARLVPSSAGKDTLTGHWELAGLVTGAALRTFPDGLPAGLMAALGAASGGREVLGGKPASGTQIIEELCSQHLVTGGPIVYTSADSVLQIAAHVDVLPPAELYRICEAAREIATGDWLVGRVIARPFAGPPGALRRTAGRRDYALAPPGPTVLDAALAAGAEVLALGKVGEVFGGRGITRSVAAPGGGGPAGAGGGNEAVLAGLGELMAGEPSGPQLIFANLGDFDAAYGHRRDPAGFAAALEDFDAVLGGLLARMGPGHLLAVTADHGCDPGYPGTDHTREDVPLLLAGTGWPPAGWGVVQGLGAVAGLISAAFALPGFALWPRRD